MRVAVSLLLLGFVVGANAVDTSLRASLLAKLGQDLSHLRSLPVNAPSHSWCPKDPLQLLGLSRRDVAQALGRADAEGNDGWTYFFTSPRPKAYEQLSYGGGFPELTFVFDDKGYVVDVTCFYAR